MKLGSRDVTRIKQARAQKAERERRSSGIVQPRFDDEEDDLSELPQSSPRVPQQDPLNEANSASHEHYSAEEQNAAEEQPAQSRTEQPAEPSATPPAAMTPALRGDSLYVPRGWGGGERGGERGGAMYEAGSGGSLAGSGSGKLRWPRAVHRRACTPVHLGTPAARTTTRSNSVSDQMVSPRSHRTGGGGGGGGGSHMKTAPRRAAVPSSPPPPLTHWQGESDSSVGFHQSPQP